MDDRKTLISKIVEQILDADFETLRKIYILAIRITS